MAKAKALTRSAQLSVLLDALRDPTRRAILLQLEKESFCCSSFGELGSKTKLSYHFAKLSAAGLIETQRAGVRRILSLRRSEADMHFPGLLDAVLHQPTAAGRRRRPA